MLTQIRHTIPQIAEPNQPKLISGVRKLTFTITNSYSSFALATVKEKL